MILEGQSALKNELLGENPFQAAEIDQFVKLATSSLYPNVHALESVLYGKVDNPA